MLNGRTALIVEEDFLIALDIQRMLENQGAGQTLFARTPGEAEQLRASWPNIAIAIVELRSHDATTVPLIESLLGAAIPVILITSDAALRKNPGLAHVDLTVLGKPVPEDAMADAIRHALAPRS